MRIYFPIKLVDERMSTKKEKVSIYHTEQESHVRKSFVICVTQLARGLLLNILQYFGVMLNIFEFSHREEFVEF